MLSKIHQSEQAKSYDFTHIWNIKLKLKGDRQKQYGGYLMEGGGEMVEGKEGQIYGDR